jgi:ribonuclease Z
MKITILGSGTDASDLPGIPDRFPPGFLVEVGGEKILFECSEGIRFRLETAGHDYATIKNVAISHIHPDHNAFIQFYQSIHNNRQWSGRYHNEPHQLNIYCPENVAEEFWHSWQLAHPYFAQGVPTLKLNFVFLPQEQGIMIGQSRLFGFPVHHGFGKIKVLAFRVESPEGIFVYSGDAGLCDGIFEAAKSADIFICEASARIADNAGSNYGHLNPKQAGEIAKRAGVKKLVLFHYTGLDAGDKIIENCRLSGFVGEIVIGKDFQVFEIKNNK